MIAPQPFHEERARHLFHGTTSECKIADAFAFANDWRLGRAKADQFGGDIGPLASDRGWFERKGAKILNLYRPLTIKNGDRGQAAPWPDHVRKVFGDEDGNASVSRGLAENDHAKGHRKEAAK